MVQTWKEECLHSEGHGRSSQDIRGAKALRKRSFRGDPLGEQFSKQRWIGADDFLYAVFRVCETRPVRAGSVFVYPEKKYSSLAQSVEHSAVNRVVVGSSPTGGA